MAQRRYDHEKWAREQVREQERQQRAALAAEKTTEREQKQATTAPGRDRAQHLTALVDRTVDRLASILHRGLDRASRLELSALLRHDPPPPLDLGVIGLPATPPAWEDFAPPEPGVLGSMLGGRTRYEPRVAEARKEFDRAKRRYDHDETDRLRHVADATERHHAAVREHEAAAAQHNARIEEMRSGLAVRDRVSVEAYLELVVARTPLPAEIPHQVELAYTPHGEQVVVRFELPPVEVVPDVVSYSYIGTAGEFREKKRAAAEIKQLYLSVVSQIALLYLRDLLEADPALENVELSGHVHAVNPATGQRDYPCLISFAVDRDRYAGLNLRDVTPAACLKYLNALVSRNPHAVEPVTPVRDFDLARYSFIESVDVIAELDSRPDLTRMTPDEFEHFIRQLFEACGLEGWTTERTGDDGVDAVVLNRDPMVGGLTIVQAKRYTRVLGVSHIRELVGAMDEKRAGRGILVTTSWFTSGCWTKARENGRVELIDGPRLRWLVQEHLKRDVLVAPPTGRARTWSPPPL